LIKGITFLQDLPAQVVEDVTNWKKSWLWSGYLIRIGNSSDCCLSGKIPDFWAWLIPDDVSGILRRRRLAVPQDSRAPRLSPSALA
jgi:hypothetical protein